MKVERVDYVNINVKNLSEAERFFSELLGITFNRIPFMVGGSTKIITEYADRGFEETDQKVAVSPIGLELIETIPPLEKEGLRAINLKVSDIEQAKAEMERKGIRLLAEATIGSFKEAIYGPEGLHGVRVSLVEYEAPDMISAMLEK